MNNIKADFFKSYKSFSVNVSLNACGIHGLLGASGAGKSATLSCITGIASPDKGSIQICGREAFSDKNKINLPPQKRSTALIMQGASMFKNMTARKNIELCVPKTHKNNRDEIVQELILLFRLSDIADKPAGVLSGGQAQRVSFARAIASNSKCILLDEPFSALDGVLKDELCAEIFPALRERKITSLYVSHDLTDLVRVCDNITVIENGTTAVSQTTSEFLQKPNTKFGAALLNRLTKS